MEDISDIYTEDLISEIKKRFEYYDEMEDRFIKVLDCATLGNMSKSNYTLDIMLAEINDKQQEFHYGIVKDDIQQLINDKGTMEDVQDYINNL